MTIPILIKRKDCSVIAQSQNGSGKTLAYLIPLIESIDVGIPCVSNGKFYP